VNSVRTRSRLLEVVSEADIEPQTREVLHHLSEADGQRTSFIRGVVTGDVWVVHHIGRFLPKQFVREAEANEMAALPTAGSA
jgi:hypothetical protein